MKILNKIRETLPAKLLEALDTVDEELLLCFESCLQDIQNLKGIDFQTQLQFAILTGYIYGTAVQKQREPNSFVSHVKEKGLIGIEFELNGKTGGMFVPKNMPNSKIKKLIQQAAKDHNTEWNGQFKKLSEFENAKMLKLIGKMF